jgi:SET domain-containing protein
MQQNSYEKYIVVKPSDIHGLGIFTSIDIPEGSLIMTIRGEVISEEECIKREEKGNVYIFWNGDSYIDSINEKKIKFLNHKCDFNCDVIDGEDNNLWLVSYRDIKAGEELTIDYGYDEIYEYCKCELCS